jgi:hypothetical protein
VQKEYDQRKHFRNEADKNQSCFDEQHVLDFPIIENDVQQEHNQLKHLYQRNDDNQDCFDSKHVFDRLIVEK